MAPDSPVPKRRSTGGGIAPVARLRVPLAPGLYTAVLGDGGHRTIQVRRADADFRRGELVLAYLAGPDNEHDYVGFAHVGRAGDVHLWRRFRDDSRLVEAARVLAGNPAAAARAYSLRSGRCHACGHVLTRPDSIARGYGRVCAVEPTRGRPVVVERPRPSGQRSWETSPGGGGHAGRRRDEGALRRGCLGSLGQL